MNVADLVLNHSPGAFSIRDLVGNYLWVSAGFHDVLGYTADELVGRNTYEFIHPDDHAAGQEGHQRLLAQDGPVVVRGRLRADDGTYRWVETSSQLVRDRQVIMSVSRWVDGRRSAMQTVQTERELANRRRTIDEQHRHFLTAISHRARHPVTIIRGMAELLHTHGGDIDEERRAQLTERIVANAAQLADLVEDVTQAERLSQRADRVQVQPVDLQALLRERLADLADDDPPITVTVPPDLVVFGDENLLGLACKALLENAIEHTPFDTPIWVESRQAHDGTIITVKDGGPGVPPALRETIFDPFHRGDPHAPDPGLGLGLHTVAEIAAVHGGRAWVDDREGGGAAFHLLLPTPAAQTLYEERTSKETPRSTSPDPQEPDAPPTIIPAPGIRVLVVDDDRIVTELMAATLEVEGFAIDVAHDGAQALQQITDSPPDLMVCDVRMPKMGGRELVTTIRATPAIEDLPVILCSAQSDDQSRWQSWASGADSFVAKPFLPDQLVAEVIRVLTQRHTASTRARQATSRTTLSDPDN